MNVLYWIHSQDQNDPMTEGYIGITKDFERRMWQHSNSDRFKDIWNDLRVEKLFFTPDPDYILEIERWFRPKNNIGWNLKKGGNAGFCGKHTPESKDKMSKALQGRKAWNKGIKTGIGGNTTPKSEETKRKISASRSGQKYTKRKPVECPHCKKVGSPEGMYRWHFHKCRSVVNGQED